MYHWLVFEGGAREAVAVAAGEDKDECYSIEEESSRLQYFTNLHAVQAFKSPPLSSPLPQLAHMLVVDIKL